MAKSTFVAEVAFKYSHKSSIHKTQEVPKACIEVKIQPEAVLRGIYWITLSLEYRFLAGFIEM